MFDFFRSSQKYLFIWLLSSGLIIILVILFFVKSLLNQSGKTKTFLQEGINASLRYAEPQIPKTELVLAGDVMLGRTVMVRSLDIGDPAHPFRKVSSVLSSSDIVFVNLENPIIKNCPKIESGFKFCAKQEMTDGLVLSGIDVVTLANNHSGNFGKEGVEETVDILAEKGILATGREELIKLNKNGTTFGFLGFDFTTRGPSKKDGDLVQGSDILVDVLVVGVHWGIEYTDKATSQQKKWARVLVDAGADVVVGHHPHWVQDSEYINSKPVFYSLGNFVFDQMWSEETKRGMVVRLTYEGEKIVKEEHLSVYINSLLQPEFVEE